MGATQIRPQGSTQHQRTHGEAVQKIEKVTQPELKRLMKLFGMTGAKRGKARKKVG